MKPIKIDWDALEEAFNNQNEELEYYLDLVTGHVVLEGEGENEAYPEDDEDLEPVARNSTSAGAADSTRVYIDPPDDELKLDWLRSFVDEAKDLDRAHRDRLEEALGADDATTAVRDLLNHDPAIRDRWYLYRSDRVHELIDRWLGEHAIAVAGQPPWR